MKAWYMALGFALILFSLDNSFSAPVINKFQFERSLMSIMQESSFPLVAVLYVDPEIKISSSSRFDHWYDRNVDINGVLTKEKLLNVISLLQVDYAIITSGDNEFGVIPISRVEAMSQIVDPLVYELPDYPTLIENLINGVENGDDKIKIDFPKVLIGMKGRDVPSLKIRDISTKSNISKSEALIDIAMQTKRKILLLINRKMKVGTLLFIDNSFWKNNGIIHSNDELKVRHRLDIDRIQAPNSILELGLLTRSGQKNVALKRIDVLQMTEITDTVKVDLMFAKALLCGSGESGGDDINLFNEILRVKPDYISNTWIYYHAGWYSEQPRLPEGWESKSRSEREEFIKTGWNEINKNHDNVQETSKNYYLKGLMSKRADNDYWAFCCFNGLRGKKMADDEKFMVITLVKGMINMPLGSMVSYHQNPVYGLIRGTFDMDHPDAMIGNPNEKVLEDARNSLKRMAKSISNLEMRNEALSLLNE